MDIAVADMGVGDGALGGDLIETANLFKQLKFSRKNLLVSKLLVLVNSA